jgi:hypothetical protein
MRSLMLTLAAAAAGLAATPALAAPCTAETVPGLWELVSVRAKEPGVEAFYKTAPYEYLRFSPERTLVYVATNRKHSAQEAEQALATTDAADGVTYNLAFLSEGRLIIFRDERPFQGFQCAIADAPAEGVLKGDMVLTELPGAPALKRVQRRMAAAD